MIGTRSRQVILATIAAALIGLVLLAGAGGAVARPKPTPAAQAAAGQELSAGKAVLLGVVEGVTEFLPISSTGHLTVTERILDIGQSDATRDPIKSYTIIIQIGAILAVFALYWRRILDMLSGLVGRSVQGRRTLVALIIAFVPAAVVGKSLEDPIESHLFGAFPVAIAWLVGGVGILAFTRWRHDRGTKGRPLELLTNRQALLIGIAQVLALWPGTSRSLVTILGGLVVGLSLPAAVEFSFLLGLATLSAATGYEMLAHGSEVTGAFGYASPLIGVAVAAISALVAVKWMVGYLNRHDLHVFGRYRIAIGVGTLLLLATGTI